jgi:hypothetical protein
MKAALFLRIAATLSLIFAAGHTAGGLKSWSPAGETDVLRQMAAFHFNASGVSRTYLDFYLGFGYFIGAYLFLQAVVLWQLASVAKSNPVQARPFVVSFLAAAIVSAVLSWAYIFVVPVVFSAVIAVFLAAALYACNKARVAQPGAPADGPASLRSAGRG